MRVRGQILLIYLFHTGSVSLRESERNVYQGR